MSESILIEAGHLSKFYGSFRAIEDVSFQIRRGEVVAFLGPNGAGKSTTMKILTGFLPPSSGRAFIAGFNMERERLQGAQKLGYLPENGPLYPDMTPRESLAFFGRARGISGRLLRGRIQRVVDICNLKSVLDKPIGKLSRGYRRRVGMAQALLHEPEALILDEPTAGLDPNQIHDIRNTIRELSATKTILLSTHVLQEVEAMAQRILFIAEGKLCFDGSVDKFLQGANSLEEKFRSLSKISK
ncbi:MAG: ABC transporter ATP-binding protein [Planctomycetia bacterium]|nr:ABC transporter ATP-binding protein [Planctomycetia bacterium]